MLYNEIGHFLLVLAGVIAFIQFITPTIGLRFNRPNITHIADPASKMGAIAISLSFMLLVRAFVMSDFSMTLVFNNSHTLKPLLYKISGTWGNHEGSLLLWTLVLSIMGASVAIFGKKTPYMLHFRTLSVQGLISLAFISFMLATSNPFDRIFPPPIEGTGLNPLLQDPGLAFHPPLLYIGYVGLSVAFSYAAAALINGRVDAAWASHMRPWVMLAWLTLTGGIILGSWWAYYELGWGGFWFWDPVENASLMPWLAATALLHSVIVSEKRNTLKAWTALLAISAFSFSLLGTFIVRSGVITSVHAFATDPERGVWILALLTIAIGGGLFLYGLRAPLLKSHNTFKPLSREGGLVINNVLLSVTAGIILTGTLYPVILEAITGAKISVGAPYFEKTVVPIFILISIVAGIGPFMDWKRAKLSTMIKYSLQTIGVASLLLFTLYAFLSIKSFGALVGMFLGIWIIIASILDVIRSIPKRHSLIKGIFKVRIQKWAMVLAHIGMATFIIGAVGASLLTKETITTLSLNQSTTVGDFTATFIKISNHKGENYVARRATLTLKGKGHVFTLSPENRRYIVSGQATTEASISGTLWYDIYVAMGDEDSEGNVVFRLYEKPFAPMLWWGGILMVLGGICSMIGVRRRNHILSEKVL